MKIAIKEPGKALLFLETNEKYQRNCVKKQLGENRYPEFVPLNKNGTLSVGVTDDGLLRKLPLNFYISCSNPYFPIQKMVGTVVFTKIKPIEQKAEEIYDYEVTDLTDEDILIIETLLSDEKQKELERYYGLVDNRIPIGFVPVKFEVMYRLESNLAMSIYQMACAILSNNLNEFHMPFYFIKKTIEYGKETDQFDKNKSNEEILRETCVDISEKANISLEYIKIDEEKVYFSLKNTVIIY